MRIGRRAAFLAEVASLRTAGLVFSALVAAVAATALVPLGRRPSTSK